MSSAAVAVPVLAVGAGQCPECSDPSLCRRRNRSGVRCGEIGAACCHRRGNRNRLHASATRRNFRTRSRAGRRLCRAASRLAPTVSAAPLASLCCVSACSLLPCAMAFCLMGEPRLKNEMRTGNALCAGRHDERSDPRDARRLKILLRHQGAARRSTSPSMPAKSMP